MQIWRNLVLVFSFTCSLMDSLLWMGAVSIRDKITGNIYWWTGVMWMFVDYCNVFISCLDSHSDGTHSLNIHWTSHVMQLFSKSVQMKKQTHLHLGWPEGKDIFQQIFSFGWTIPLNISVFFPPNDYTYRSYPDAQYWWSLTHAALI